MPTPALSLSPATATDLPVLRAMLIEAAWWRDRSAAPPPEVALADPGLAVYLDAWPRPGDVGILARVDGTAVGAAWVRRFSAERPGYGYLDDHTPELSIAVAAALRGRGVGTALMAALLATLRLADVAQVSLSVEEENPARDWYERLGFVPLQRVEGAVTMVRRLG